MMNEACTKLKENAENLKKTNYLVPRERGNQVKMDLVNVNWYVLLRYVLAFDAKEILNKLAPRKSMKLSPDLLPSYAVQRTLEPEKETPRVFVDLKPEEKLKSHKDIICTSPQNKVPTFIRNCRVFCLPTSIHFKVIELVAAWVTFYSRSP